MPAGGDIILAEHVTYPPPQQMLDGTNQTGINSATAATGSPVCGVAFVAPPSGRVGIHLLANVQVTAGTGAPGAQVGVILRTSATLGGGTVVSNGMTEDPGVSMTWVAPTPPFGGKQSASLMITGLTPGASYNAVVYHQTYGGTGTTFTVYNRAVRAEPLP